jgi:hypothetical protein
MYGDMLKRARPDQFLHKESLRILQAKTIRFSRVLVAPKSIVLMDGLNLAISNRDQLRRRSSDIGCGFFSFGEVKEAVQSVEQKELVRTSFIFNRPAETDRELDYFIQTVRRDADVCVDNHDAEDIRRFNHLLRTKTLST